MFALSQGKIAAQGTPVDLAKIGVDFVTRDDDDADGRQDQLIANGQKAANARRKSSIRSNYSISSLDDSIFSENDDDALDELVSQLEESSKGTVNGSILTNYFQAGVHWSMLLLLSASFLATQFVASVADIWISIWCVCLYIACGLSSWVK